MEILQVNKLEYQVGGRHLLQDISFSLESGQRVAILGHNGAGKSTLIDLIVGALKPTAGQARLFGKPFRKTDRRKLGVVFDSLEAFPQLAIREVVRYFQALYGLKSREKAEQLLESLGLSAHLDKRIRQLSKGERKKVWLVLATMHQPELLILDEATSELDPFVRERCWKQCILNQPGRAVLFTTHSWEEAQQYSDAIVFLNKGRMPMQLANTQRLLSSEYLPIKQKVVVQREPALAAFLEQANAHYYEDNEQLHILPNDVEEALSQIKKVTASYSIVNTGLMDVYALSTKKIAV